MEYHNNIFPIEIKWTEYDEGVSEILDKVKELPDETFIPERKPSTARDISPHRSSKMASFRTMLSKFNATFDGHESSVGPEANSNSEN